MSSDNRTVHTDALATLGTIIDDKQERDAIHLAVLPAVAGERLRPGAHVAIADGKAYACTDMQTHGIVDPFLRSDVAQGERFWFVIYPRQITSLRHVWEHPAFPDVPPVPRELTPEEQDVVDLTRGKIMKPASIQWLKNFCEQSSGPSFESLMEKLESGEIADPWDRTAMHFNGTDAHGEIPPEFWGHVENVIGRKLGPDERPEYFSCAC